MSSGGSIPYHLRQAKAVERNIFLDLLARVGRAYDISSYTYVGFGGPFLEDHKAVHAALRIERMFSIEGDPKVYARQQFNQPIACVELRNQKSGEFLNSFEFENAAIVWLDYTTPREIGTQLSELRSLVEKLSSGDVFKITVNANAASLGTAPCGGNDHEHRLETALSRIGEEYRPADFSVKDIMARRYPFALARAIGLAARKGLGTRRGYVVVPLTSCMYSDGQLMLTVTGIVLSRASEPNFWATTRIRSWPFYSADWANVHSIDVPAFSAKERLHVEALLPTANATQVRERLGFDVDPDEERSSELFANFVRFYRHFPAYARVSL